MRRSELLAIRWSDVDLYDMKISISRTMQYLNGVKDRFSFKEPKSKQSRRLIALSPSTVLVLKEYKEIQENTRKSL
jgi:integrase